MGTVSYVSIVEFSVLLGVCKNTVLAWLKKGMPHVRVGRLVRIVRPAADEWLANGGAAALPRRLPRAERVPVRKDK